MTGQALVDTGPIVANLLESDEHHEACVPGIGAILARYEGLRIQLADASLVHLANREGIETMFTLDRRDFGVLRLAHGKKLRLIP